MRQGTIIIAATTLLILSFVAGCNPSVTPDPPPSSSENFMTGSVRLGPDEFGNPVPPTAGIVVTVSNSTTSYKDTTDSSGVWIIYDLPAGVYKIYTEYFGFHGDTVGQMGVSMSNIQYVGAGGYIVGGLGLWRDLASTMITRIDPTIKWSYLTKDTYPYEIVDSVPRLILSVKTRNVTRWSYTVYISTSPNDDCSQAEYKLPLSAEPSLDGTFQIEFSETPYSDLKRKYGDQVKIMQFYVHVRPKDHGMFNPATQTREVRCVDQLSVPFKFKN
ncbi:MAG: carboxypeptidase regulatory-like domain-containing protein [Ignavibacteria bacterium]|nr:carboxypeptidase regulatory-like domain-containing protein [Ignavibacteria bacterium]